MHTSGDDKGPAFLAERVNVLELMSNLITARKYERAIEVGRKFVGLFDRYSLWDEWARAAEMGLTAARELKDEVAESRFLLELAYIGTERGCTNDDIERARKLATQALEAATRHGAYGVMGDVETALGNIICRQGDHRAALQYFGRAVEHYSQRSDRSYPEKTINNAAKCKLHIGQAHAAIDDYRDLLRRRQERGDEVGAANVLTNLSSAYLATGRPQEALEAADEGIVLYRDHRIERELAEAIVNRANALLALGNAANAVAELELALDMFQQIGDRPSVELATAYLDKARAVAAGYKEA